MNQEADQLDCIAVIGMAGRFPDANNVEQFGNNLRSGVESVTDFTDEQLLSAGVEPSLVQAPNYVKSGVLLEGVDQFDAGFFGYTPREAELTDPQHRVFLESAWEALEDAGYDADRTRLRIGVFAGAGPNLYFQNNLLSNPNLTASLHYLQKVIATQSDYLSTRVSYKLNLKGPSLTIQTACSSSLVAVHIACQSLLNGECDIALAGGVSIKVPQIAGYLYEQGSTFSSDGRCRAFDASSQGMMPGSGAAIVVLKRLADALEDGDSIRAVIRGSAINNDGADKVGYTAPSVEGPASVIATAQALAGVGADEIDYVEAMGTGTALGDPIEVAALEKAFRRTSQRQGFCAIGSVKTNIGHLGAASGIAGLVKAVLALESRLLFPSLNFKRSNPAIDFANSPFYVQQTLEAWEPKSGRRVAGVSSFGVGGTNAHVIVEEFPPATACDESRSWQLLPISARSPAALEKATDRLAEFLAKHPQLNLADVAFTLQQGRKSFAHRRILAAKSVDEAAALLRTRDRKRVFTALEEHPDRPITFMFPDQSAQYFNMGLEIYRTEKTFKKHVDFCCEFLKQTLYPAAGQAGGALAAEPAMFVVEYALAKLWMEWGVNPDAMIGHGVGEYVAACLAGVFSLEDALTLAADRGRQLAVRDIKLNAPKIPYISSLTGVWIKPSESTDPGYWSNWPRQITRFAEGLGELGKVPRVFLEVGPGQTLASLSRQIVENSNQVVLTSFGPPWDETSEVAGMLTTFGQLWTAGVCRDLHARNAGQKRRRVSLPSYPFERQRYWIEPKKCNPSVPSSVPANIPNRVRDAPKPGNLSQYTDLQGILTDVWREVFGYEKIGEDDNFFDIGGDSLLATVLLSRLRTELRVELPPNSVFLAPTITAQMRLIAKTAIRDTHDVIVPIQKGSASRPPFFMIHSYHLYTPLPRHLGSGQPFYGVEEFGVADPVDNWALESMMSRYVEGIRSVEPHGPYFIGGFCSAAIPAFEVARQLEEAGEFVPLLVIIDPIGRTVDGDVQKTRLERLSSRRKSARVVLRIHTEKMKAMSVSAMARYAGTLLAFRLRNFLTNMQILGWRRICRFYMRCGFKIPSVLRRKLISGIRMVTLEAIRRYSFKPYKGDIVVFLTTHANLVPEADYVGPWRDATSGNVHVVRLPGDHATAFTEPNIRIFAQELSDALDASIGVEQSLDSGGRTLSASAV